MDESTATKAPIEGTDDKTLDPVENTDKDEILPDETNPGKEISPEISPDKEPFSKTTKSVQKRINELNGRIAMDKEGHAAELAKANARIADLQEKNTLQDLALSKKSDPIKSGPPNPGDFDAGEYDAGYAKAVQAYQDARMDERFDKKVDDALNVSRETQRLESKQRDLEVKQKKHLEKAVASFPNYYDLEDKAIDVLGKKTVNTIITDFSHSHLILGHLGGNPEKLEEIAEMLDSKSSNFSPVQGIASLGVLEAELMKEAPKTKLTPAPDTELPGGSPTADTGDAMYDKLLAEASKTGNVNKFLDYTAKRRKEAKSG